MRKLVLLFSLLRISKTKFSPTFSWRMRIIMSQARSNTYLIKYCLLFSGYYIFLDTHSGLTPIMSVAFTLFLEPSESISFTLASLVSKKFSKSVALGVAV